MQTNPHPPSRVTGKDCKSYSAKYALPWKWKREDGRWRLALPTSPAIRFILTPTLTSADPWGAAESFGVPDGECPFTLPRLSRIYPRKE